MTAPGRRPLEIWRTGDDAVYERSEPAAAEADRREDETALNVVAQMTSSEEARWFADFGGPRRANAGEIAECRGTAPGGRHPSIVRP